MVHEKKVVRIGKVHSSQGLKGHVFVVFKATETPWVDKWSLLLLSTTEAGPVTHTFPILHKKEHSKQGKNGWTLALQGVDTKTQSDELEKMWVWIPEEFLIADEGETIYLRQIENFMVIDRTRGEVGPIIGFASNGAQDLIQIQTKLGVFDVPLVDAFIDKIDYQKKSIFMDIPQGLLEDL